MLALYFLTSYLFVSTFVIVVGGLIIRAAGETDKPSHLGWGWSVGTAILSATLLYFLYQEFGNIWPWVLHLATSVYGTVYNFIKSARGPRPVNWPMGIFGLFLSWVIVIGYWSYA